MDRQPQQNRQAGHNVRQLALKRRVKAISLFGMASLAIATTVTFHRLSVQLFQLAAGSTAPAQTDQSPPFLLYLYALYLYALGGAIALVCVFGGLHWWKRAGHADQGAAAEVAIATLLRPLTTEGWQIEYGLWLGKGLGDADVVCLSPQQRAFVIDVKSHRGTVVIDGKQLLRECGAEKKPFEKDFLQQTMKQALQVKAQKNWSFVTPILAFSAAQIALPDSKLQGVSKLKGVYVVEARQLVSLLRSLG
ncbi:MAG: nuclease-related domain-containing protein [Cyanobacteriota bacterium]